MASWAPGRLDVFAGGVDGQLWHRAYDGGWSGWEPLGGRLVGAPAVASWAPGRLDVFVGGVDGQLWRTWYEGGWAPATLSSVVIDGQGSGHGRGLSAWGTFGWAVNYGWSWQQILDHYYGNTTWGAVGNIPMRIRLMALDGQPESGVISTSGAAMWGGSATSRCWRQRPRRRVFDIWASSTKRLCPGTYDPSWTLIQSAVVGPIVFTTPYDETAAAPGDVLGLCQPDGSVVHYRGSIGVLSDATGVNRTVNETYLQNYLRGVLPREVPATWGNAGGGAGMHALWAFSVAARSFGVSQNRYAYAKTCDTAACQVYGGTAHRRPGPNDVATVREHQLTDRAVAETGGTVRIWPDGRVVSAEYSASHGPRNAGGQFPAVDDPADNVPQNPNHRWSRTLDANVIGAHYGIGQLTAAWTERDPASIYDGVWGNRVRLQGTGGSVTIANWDFRNTWGLLSPGFVIRAAG